MRQITDHLVPGSQSELCITVTDEPGAGGACHRYKISGFDSSTNPSDPFTEGYGAPADHSTVLFQNGPIKEAGPNGVTNEALIAICIDRLRSFQAGPFPSKSNLKALVLLELALSALQERTRDRIARGVEGITKA